MKTCRKCNESKPDADFYLSCPSQCKECRRAQNRAYHATNRERITARNKARNTPEHYRRWNLKTNYGLTIEQYDAMLKAQGGGCAVCKAQQTTRNLHVDHDHATGKIRGILCHECNTALGLLHEDEERFIALLKYVKGST